MTWSLSERHSKRTIIHSSKYVSCLMLLFTCYLKLPRSWIQTLRLLRTKILRYALLLIQKGHPLEPLRGERDSDSCLHISNQEVESTSPSTDVLSLPERELMGGKHVSVHPLLSMYILVFCYLPLILASDCFQRLGMPSVTASVLCYIQVWNSNLFNEKHNLGEFFDVNKVVKIFFL